jgi:hypothetical protein
MSVALAFIQRSFCVRTADCYVAFCLDFDIVLTSFLRLLE